MPDHRVHLIGRRQFVAAGAAIAALATLGIGPARAQAAPLRIGIIGAGRIGSLIGEFWVKAGHQVMFNDINAETVRALTAKLGTNARSGTAKETVAFGDVVVISVPYGAYPAIARDVGADLRGKILLDTGNPNATRDGEMAAAALAKGAGVATAEFFPGARVVRAFSTINFRMLASETGRAGDKLAIPLASDDAEALAVASRLVRDAGFEPFVVGNLARGKDFDPGNAKGTSGPHTAAELKQLLGM